MQKIQDWITQQWVILTGRKINLQDMPWLQGPFGSLDGIGENFINELVESENLAIERGCDSQGLIPSIEILNLPEQERSRLSQNVIDFYENTSDFDLEFRIKWNPLFKVFGIIINRLFSSRLNQLNPPMGGIKKDESIKSEIITLADSTSTQVKYTVWLRTIRSTGRIMYSGVYGTCTLPCGRCAIKAVFPLPKGNATVFMLPRVGADGELILESSGKQFGDCGFYFLLTDSKGNNWARYVRSFRDVLIVASTGHDLSANQTLILWNKTVLKLSYKMVRRVNGI